MSPFKRYRRKTGPREAETDSRHSPVDLGVAAGKDDRGVSVRFRVLGGTSAQKSRFLRFLLKILEMITFQYFQNKVTQIRGEIRIWGYVGLTHLSPSTLVKTSWQRPSQQI